MLERKDTPNPNDIYGRAVTREAELRRRHLDMCFTPCASKVQVPDLSIEEECDYKNVSQSQFNEIPHHHHDWCTTSTGPTHHHHDCGSLPVDEYDYLRLKYVGFIFNDTNYIIDFDNRTVYHRKVGSVSSAYYKLKEKITVRAQHTRTAMTLSFSISTSETRYTVDAEIYPRVSYFANVTITNLDTLSKLTLTKDMYAISCTTMNALLTDAWDIDTFMDFTKVLCLTKQDLDTIYTKQGLIDTIKSTLSTLDTTSSPKKAIYNMLNEIMKTQEDYIEHKDSDTEEGDDVFIPNENPNYECNHHHHHSCSCHPDVPDLPPYEDSDNTPDKDGIIGYKYTYDQIVGTYEIPNLVSITFLPNKKRYWNDNIDGANLADVELIEKLYTKDGITYRDMVIKLPSDSMEFIVKSGKLVDPWHTNITLERRQLTNDTIDATDSRVYNELIIDNFTKEPFFRKDEVRDIHPGFELCGVNLVVYRNDCKSEENLPILSIDTPSYTEFVKPLQDITNIQKVVYRNIFRIRNFNNEFYDNIELNKVIASAKLTYENSTLNLSSSSLVTNEYTSFIEGINNDEYLYILCNYEIPVELLTAEGSKIITMYGYDKDILKTTNSIDREANARVDSQFKFMYNSKNFELLSKRIMNQDILYNYIEYSIATKLEVHNEGYAVETL